MARLLCVPDKLRGSLSARRALEAMAAAVARTEAESSLQKWHFVGRELSDGGEGFAAIVSGSAGERICLVDGPLDGVWHARWWRPVQGGLAVIEAAEACGLERSGGRLGNDALRASSRGVGQLIRAALDDGARHIVIGCGGSATTDGGRGALEALGTFPPRNRALGDEVRLTVAYDVHTGFLDAPAAFGPQKGASATEVLELERRLAELADLYRSTSGLSVETLPGSGAAGGLAGGLAALGAELVSGFDFVAETIALDSLLEQADAIVTAEGRLDDTSFSGKVVGRILEAAHPGTPVLVVAGSATESGLARARELGAEVSVLADRYGIDRSYKEPAVLVTKAVADFLLRLG
jgi:glycerate kinase